MSESTQLPPRHARASTELRWQFAVAVGTSIVLSIPLLLRGTPDVESYSMSIFSTVAFARNLLAGVDPWYVSGYGFGIPLPTSSWLIKFPPAIPAALLGVDGLYAAVWLGGEFLFSFYFLKLCSALTRYRGTALVLLATGLLSFSNLGTSYVDDWPEHFLGWAFFPACLWFVARTLLADSTRERVRAAAACALVLGIFTGSAHQNEMVTFYSGMAIVLAFLLWSRPKSVLAVGMAMVVALASALDVLVPTVRGMLEGGLNPAVEPLAITPDAPSLASYGIFLEPLRTFAVAGLDGVFEPAYQRLPFFGLLVLALAVVGAIGLFRARAPAGALPNDLARAVSVGFLAYSVLTLLPPWVVLNLPRMWMYRDGQTVFGLLCAAAALDWMRKRHGRLVWPVMALHLAQMALVAAPIVFNVFGNGNEARLFSYARREHALFEGLRQAGVTADSRVLLAGQLEQSIRGFMPEAGVTAETDFPLEGLAVVNAWYRGGLTPELGSASMEGRYGTYETYISWSRNLRHLTPRALDVLGISHVAALENDLDEIDVAAGLTSVASIELPGGERRVSVLRNDDAWGRATLLAAGTVDAPPLRPDCPLSTIYCRDYDRFSQRLQAKLRPEWAGSSMHVNLPPEHRGGTLFVSAVVGPNPRAAVDGQPREVRLFMGTFGTIEIAPGDREVTLSVRPTDRIALSVVGFVLLTGCLAVTVMARRRA